MNIRFILLIGVTALLAIWAFNRKLRAARYDVLNRGVNEAGIVTALRAFWQALALILAYAVVFYLLIASYYYLRFRSLCHRDTASRIAYEAQSQADHIREALAWPTRDENAPECRQ